MLRQALKLALESYPQNLTTDIGEPILSNLLGAAQMVAEMDLLSEAVAATILLEIPDTLQNWQEVVAEKCGPTVVNIIRGL